MIRWVTLFCFVLLATTPVFLTDVQLSNVNSCLKAALQLPGNRLNGRTLAGIVGYGWDDLQSVVTKPVFLEEFKRCQAEPTGVFLLPDNVVATPILQTSLDRMAEYYSSFNDYKESDTNTFTASAGGQYHLFKASGSFSRKHQETKEIFAKYKSSLLHTKMIYRSFNLYRDSYGILEPGFINRIEMISNALYRNLTDQAKYLSEVVVRDYGTHYISTAETGALIDQETFIDSSYAFTTTTTLDSIRATAAAGFGLLFHASVGDTHEVTTENKKTLSQITSHQQISTNGGPDVNSVLAMADNGTLLVNNLVSLSRDGDWLYNLVNAQNFPNIDSSILLPTQMLLKNATELYYKKNTIRGCTDMNSANYNFQANYDDGTCKPNNDSYPFGGIYQTCTTNDDTTPEWRCDNFTQDNTFVGGHFCDQTFYEPVKLIEEIYTFEDRVVNEPKKKCHGHWIFKKCHWVDYYVHYKDSVKVSAFWCRKKADITLPANTGAMFGGLYEDGKVNEFTGEAGCPGAFQHYRLGRSATVCISYQYEQDHAYSVPIEKFFSCQTIEKDKKCSANFTQELISVENNCDLYYCIRKQTYKQYKHPILKRPPFTLQKLAASNYSEHTVRAVYKGVELFAVPFSTISESTFQKVNASFIQDFIEEAHVKILIVSNNLTASAAETLKNIHEAYPDD